jgi:hypothetical protein
MIEPTIGRIVWYRGTVHDLIPKNDQPLAAIVTYVWGPRLVNLAVFDPNGMSFSRTSVEFLQDGDAQPRGNFCEWMPYQKGQAAKTEKLEAVLASR